MPWEPIGEDGITYRKLVAEADRDKLVLAGCNFDFPWDCASVVLIWAPWSNLVFLGQEADGETRSLIWRTPYCNLDLEEGDAIELKKGALVKLGDMASRYHSLEMSVQRHNQSVPAPRPIHDLRIRQVAPDEDQQQRPAPAAAPALRAPFHLQHLQLIRVHPPPFQLPAPLYIRPEPAMVVRPVPLGQDILRLVGLLGDRAVFDESDDDSDSVFECMSD